MYWGPIHKIFYDLKFIFISYDSDLKCAKISLRYCDVLRLCEATDFFTYLNIVVFLYCVYSDLFYLSGTDSPRYSRTKSH